VLNIVGIENFSFAEGPDAHGYFVAHHGIFRIDLALLLQL
jgi:hypothetical protein